MTPEQRQEAILELLDVEGAATYRGLAELLSVSSMTVRRDCAGQPVSGSGTILF